MGQLGCSLCAVLQRHLLLVGLRPSPNATDIPIGQWTLSLIGGYVSAAWAFLAVFTGGCTFRCRPVNWNASLRNDVDPNLGCIFYRISLLVVFGFLGEVLIRRLGNDEENSVWVSFITA